MIPAVLFLLPGMAGAGWVQQQSGTTATLISVYFVNPQTGWVAGDSNFILRTTDSGSHWSRIIVDTLIGGTHVVRFWDIQLGYTFGRRGFYKSTDGGLTWIYLSAMAGTGFVFVTPLKGWLVRSMLHTGDGGEGDLFQTTDGGGTWIHRDSSHTYIFWDVAFADSMFGWYTADNHAIFIGSLGYMKQTTDGGVTWQTVSSSSFAFGSVRFSGRNLAWRSWRYFVPPSTDEWGIDKTTDRGVHWTGIYQSRWYWIPALSVVDTLKGSMIVWYDSLATTRDGGATWDVQWFSGAHLQDVFFTDSLNGWAVGEQGLILHTTDGGSGVWSEPSRLSPSASRLTVVPNPFVSFTSVPGYASERFALFDLSGRKVGTYRGDRVGEGLSAGVYFLKSEGKDTKPLRIVKLR